MSFLVDRLASLSSTRSCRSSAIPAAAPMPKPTCLSRTGPDRATVTRPLVNKRLHAVARDRGPASVPEVARRVEHCMLTAWQNRLKAKSSPLHRGPLLLRLASRRANLRPAISWRSVLQMDLASKRRMAKRARQWIVASPQSLWCFHQN